MWHYGRIDKLLHMTYTANANLCFYIAKTIIYLNHSSYLGYSQAEETVVMRGLQWY